MQDRSASFNFFLSKHIRHHVSPSCVNLSHSDIICRRFLLALEQRQAQPPSASFFVASVRIHVRVVTGFTSIHDTSVSAFHTMPQFCLKQEGCRQAQPLCRLTCCCCYCSLVASARLKQSAWGWQSRSSMLREASSSP